MGDTEGGRFVESAEADVRRWIIGCHYGQGEEMIGPRVGEVVRFMKDGVERVAIVEFLWWAMDEPACRMSDGSTLFPVMEPWRTVRRHIDPDVIGAGR